MPISGTAAKGIVNVMLEANTGEQLLLATTGSLGTITGFTAPTGSTGMRLHIKVTNWSTSGTVTINGTGNPANTENYSIAAPTAQQSQSAQLVSNEYVSVNAYSAITNITTTGLTGALITVWGIYAGKFTLPSIFTSNRAIKVYSPNEHNAFIERDKKILQLVNNTSIDIKQDVYADLSLWWPYMIMGTPTIATLPSSPTSLLATTSITSTMSLTSQPTAPGMKLILTITSFTVAGTLTIAGTSYGQAVSESISITAAGTYYSSNVYSAVNASGITNVSTAASIAVTGVYGWSLTFLSGGSLYSAAIEWFDGVGSWAHPFSLATEGDFDIKVQQEATLTLKGKAADKLPIGDRTTTPLAGTNRIASIGANLSDMPIVGWQSLMYLDPITGTSQTTAYNNCQELKVSLKVPQEEHWTFTNTQTYNRSYAVKRECVVEASLDFLDYLQWEQFRQSLKQYLAFQFIGQYIGTTGGSPQYKSWTWTLPIRSDGVFDVTSDPSKGMVSAKAGWRTEYDSGIGGSYKLVVVTQLPPTYPN